MKINHLLLITIFSILFWDNTFSQTASNTEICAGGTVNFNANMSLSTYYWDFKDLAVSNLKDPSHIFASPGLYQVELKESKSGPIKGSISITVYEKPIIVITSDANFTEKGCSPLNTSLNATTLKALPLNVSATYNWITGDGTPEYINKNKLTHTYKTGVYNVTITLNSNMSSCNTSLVLNNYISVSDYPNVNFTTTPSNPSACVGPINISSFNNTSKSPQAIPLTYNWDFGNSKISNVKDGEAQSYTVDGKYTITLTAKDTNNCSSSFSRVISLGKPKASFIVNDTVCINNPFSISNTSGINGTWKIDGGANLNNLTQHTFNTKGNHTISLTVSLNGCSDDTLRNIYIQDPTIEILSTPSYSCNDTLTSFYSVNLKNDLNTKIKTYSWSFDTKFGTPNATNIAKPKCFYNTYDTTYHYRKQNKYLTDLTITTYAGCTAKAESHYDTIHEMWAKFVPSNYQGCKDLTIDFADSSTSHYKKSIALWEWDFGDGTPLVSSTSKTTPSHTYKNEGVYDATLKIYDNLNKSIACKDTSYKVQIKVGSPLALSFTASPSSICPGDKVTLTNTSASNVKTKIDAWHYSSNKEKTFHCFKDENINLVFNDTVGQHTITLTGEYNGCQSTTTKIIDVKGPIADFDYIVDCKFPNRIKLINKSQNQGTTSITWNLGETILTSSADTITYDFVTPGDKKIVMTAINNTSGCKNHKDSVYIHIGTINSSMDITDINKQIPDLTAIGSKPIIDGGANYLFDASASTDVYQYCYRGYSFITEKGDRPFTYSNTKDTFQLNQSFDQYTGMVVRNKNNCVDTTKTIVRVINMEAKFNVTNTLTNDITLKPICLPITLKLDDLSTADTTITNWEWDFGDNTKFNGQTPPNHLYTTNSVQNDTVFISLKITNQVGFTRTIQKAIPIYKPEIKLTSTPDIDPTDKKIHICSGKNVNLNAEIKTGVGLTFKWNFEDLTTTKTNPTSKVFNLATTASITEKDQIVKVVFTEPTTGCKDSINQIVNIEIIPKAIIASDKDAERVFCHPFNVTFNNSKIIAPTGTITTWQLTPSISISRDDASYSYPKGNHSVKQSLVSPNSCKHDTIFPFKVIGPQGKITASPLSICKGESIKFGIKDTSDITSFTWDFADGKTQLGGAPVNHTYYTLEPKLKVQLKMSGNGCEFIDTVSIGIKQVVANFDHIELSPAGVDTVLCIGDGIKFTNTSTNANIFKWELGENETSTLKDISSKKYTKADTINVRLFASSSTLNCKDTITKQIIVNQPPKITVIPDTICINNSITLKTVENLSTFSSFTWSSNDLLPKQTSIYSITVKDKENCIGTNSAQFIVIQEPDDTPFTDTIIIGDQVTLPVDNNFGANIFTWTPPTKLSCLDCANPIAGPLLADTVYSLLIEDVKNCFQKTKIFTIIVKPITHIKLPTTFTPNGDGNNDIVFVRGWGIKKLISFEIYNRWGELMYKGTDINEGWNGYYKDELQNNDVYAYKVIALSWLNDTEMVKEGYIHLMR